jgi:RimJ/RimL family protein N-acetyltransferase
VDLGRPGVGLAEIWSMTAVVNEPSQAVMRRIGMSYHTGFEHPKLPVGHPLRPHVVYRLARPGGQERVQPPVEL